MNRVTFRRILKSGIVSFFRNGLVSVATVLVMSLSLFTVGGVFIGSIFVNTFIERLQSKVDVSVYFKKEIPEQAIIALQDKVKALPQVKSVRYISRDEALKTFLEQHKGEDLIQRSIEVIDDNPFSASLEIAAADPGQYEPIALFVEQKEFRDIIDLDSRGQLKITYRQNQETIDKLSNMLNTARRIGLGIGIILASIALIVAYNTVRLAIYNAREEIAVMQLVGASRSFIRGPFIVEGVIHGLTAAFFTIAILYPGLWWIGAKTYAIFGDLNIFDYFISNVIQLTILMVVGGVLLGTISARIAIRRYLRV
jgi:cell division transport system permease protein